MQATLTFLGSGTSMGVPTLGCMCAVCRSAAAPAGNPAAEPRNRRTRPSLRLQWTPPGDIERTILIDTGPDLHAQAIREGITRLDAVLYTHHHADHILGMDDLRPLSFGRAEDLPLFADEKTTAALERVFNYTFRTGTPGEPARYPTSARVKIHALPTAGQSITLFGVDFQRIPVTHGRETIVGYRFGSAAYLTDMSELPPEALAMLHGLDILILDALRREPHPSHSHLAKSVAYVEQLAPRRAFFTHISHDLDHAPTEGTLPPKIRLAYDGLQLQFDIAETHVTPRNEQGASRAVSLRQGLPAGEAVPPPTPMQIFHSLAEIPTDFGPVVATVGNFDGVHRGHRWVIEQLKTRARALGLRSLAITFDPHPARALRPQGPHVLITPLAQKVEQLTSTGIDATLILPFTPELRDLSPECFARDILCRGVHAREVHEGENFRFGSGASADMAGLAGLGKELGFSVVACAPHLLRGGPVSSTRIRNLVAAGQVSRARALLGRPFSILSTPAPGRGYGTRYTVPTINLAPYAELLPGNGVYITKLRIGEGTGAECFEAVTNVGNRPTFGADSFTVESHLLDFHPVELSATTPLELSFLKRLRNEQRFESPEVLRTQIRQDVRRAQRFFALASKIL